MSVIVCDGAWSGQVPDAPLPPPVELLDALPEVPFYRPLPRPPVSVPPARAAAKRLMDEEEALASVLHNKNKRWDGISRGALDCPG